MKLLRGHCSDPVADHERSREAVDRVARSGEPAVRVWCPPRHVTFGRRDRNAGDRNSTADYRRAREVAADRGFPPIVRDVGGRAVAVTGETVAVLLATPIDDAPGAARIGIQERYDRVVEAVLTVLDGLGVDAERGEPPDSFCPGTHSLRTSGKVAGFAQRVRSDVAVVAGVVLVADREAVADVLDPVYAALGVPFDPAAVGSIAAAGGAAADDPDDATVVRRALEDALAERALAELAAGGAGRDRRTVERVRET